MDLNYLQNTLKTNLEQYHQKENIRYRNIGISSKNLHDLDDVTQTLRGLLPNYELWQYSGIQNAPEARTNKKNLEKQILAVQKEGIIIHQPEQWTSYWSLADKSAFWSTLAMWHDNIKIVLVFTASNEFQQINHNYFKPQPLDGLFIQIWRPTRAE
ncbi:conserved hypothetical protein [Bathymodiolus platifrons methanotrophic gill symbiont]|uniref:hypothetical protein n=1 Tax=unclassified Gammaproteobacteria TaxID=33811 RepID=UPI000B41EB2D|nr:MULTISPECIES: hypothetical protein [unclassified Gammaproteobacteria]MCK5872693.1 hypothetical protein [Methylococcales bacterium]TXK94055.1 hypothetical protein BMR10_14210 [Methylococcaceae bacterium CS4]TXK95570.1 hypothetical protein BMR11_13385 [Methylococcaceae bacterium CS5]TXL03573.1 hypothetical protein BMR07_14845 [Methylococcaceae bacterium CS1]TXL03623.1 hypothetical protein BMR09_14510 [Methylococcaceae bacterium CS3]TXL06558.1 hypothetical protein BMR08_15315 [Methylococcacea